MSHPAHLHARGVSFILVSLAELEKLQAYRQRMGWELPWYSSAGTSFNDDMGATIDGDENHVVSVFLRDGDDVSRTYFTEDRGVEHLAATGRTSTSRHTAARKRGGLTRRMAPEARLLPGSPPRRL